MVASHLRQCFSCYVTLIVFTDCPHGWVANGDVCYLFVSDSTGNWTEAKVYQYIRFYRRSQSKYQIVGESARREYSWTEHFKDLLR